MSKLTDVTQIPPVLPASQVQSAPAVSGEEGAPDLPPEAALVQLVTKAAPPPLTYGPKGDSNASEQYAQLQRLVASYLTEQGLGAEVAVGDGETAAIEDLSAEDAAALVSEDGYWGVEATSERIADFALAMVGSDPTRVEEVRGAMVEGFAEAREALGGTLPDISEQTIDAALARFDEGVA